jgi:hypothetical protein
MRIVMMTLLVVVVMLQTGQGQATVDSTELLLEAALTQDDIREILGDGNQEWITESVAVVPRPPEGAQGVSVTYAQGHQVIRLVIYDFELSSRANDFIQTGIESVQVDLSGEPFDVTEEFIDPETEELKLLEAIWLAFNTKENPLVILHRPHPIEATSLVVILRGNLSQTDLISLSKAQLDRLIESGK